MCAEILQTADRILLPLLAGRVPETDQALSTADSAALLEHLIDCWQVLPSLDRSPVDRYLQTVLTPSDYACLARMRLAITCFARAQSVVSRQLLLALQQRGIRYSLLKGTAAGFVMYENPVMRTGWDLDLGVAKDDLEVVRGLAEEVGFISAQQDGTTKRFYRADPKFKAAVEATHYELGFLVKRIAVTNLSSEAIDAIRAEPRAQGYWFDVEQPVPHCYVSIDVHHALSLDIPFDDLLASATERRVDADLVVRVPDLSWLAVHLIFKVYWEGIHSYAKGLYEYADLVRLLPLLDATTFERAVQALTQYRLRVAAYYVLRRLPLFGVELPAHVVTFLEGERRVKSGEQPFVMNDFGDVWPKLFGYR